MKIVQKLTRLSLAVALFASLGACTVVPMHSAGYRAAPVYVESYPAYQAYPSYRSYPSTNIYYESDRRRYDNRGGGYYREEPRRDERRYQEPRRMESPLQGAAELHRDVRRSLGLPRLPGMP